MGEISPKAIVVNPAGLAEDVRVGPFTFIGPDVTVGAGTVLENNVTITGRVTIGRNCRFMPGCVIGGPGAAGNAQPGAAVPHAVPAQAGAADSSGRVTIGDGNTIREHVIIEGGSTPEGTVLAANNLLMVGCQVGADARLDGSDIFANFTRIEPHAHVEQFVQTSGFATVGEYATVGAYTFTTGYTGIDRDAPPYAIVHGFPFRVRGANAEKLRRCGFDAATIELLKTLFHTLFNGSATPSLDKIRAADAHAGNQHVKYLLDSLRRAAQSRAGKRLAEQERQG